MVHVQKKQNTGSADSNRCISDEHFFMIKLHSNQNRIIFGILKWGDLIKNTYFLYLNVLMITITTYLKNSESFLPDICFNQNKNKCCSFHSPAFLKILKKPRPTLLQKQTIPHMKALLFSFLEPEEQVSGIVMRGPHPHPVTFLNFFFLRSWRPSEVDETKTECFISNLPISGSQK